MVPQRGHDESYFFVFSSSIQISHEPSLLHGYIQWYFFVAAFAADGRGLRRLTWAALEWPRAHRLLPRRTNGAFVGAREDYILHHKGV